MSLIAATNRYLFLFSFIKVDQHLKNVYALCSIDLAKHGKLLSVAPPKKNIYVFLYVSGHSECF